MVLNTVEWIFSIAVLSNAILFLILSYRQPRSVQSSILPSMSFIAIAIAAIYQLVIMHYLFAMSLTVTAIFILKVSIKRRANDGNQAAQEVGFQQVLDQLPGHVYWKNKDGVMMGSNRQNWQDFGLDSADDYLGKTDFDLFPKEEAKAIRTIDQEVMEKSILKVVEEVVTTNNKEAIYLSYKSPLFNDASEVVGMLGVSVDITQAKKETIEQLEMLEKVIAATPGNVYWMNKDGVYLGCNDNQASVIGLSSRKEIVGKKNIDIQGFLIPDVLDPINQQVMQTGKTLTVEEPAMLQDGTTATFLSNKVPLRNQAGSVVGMVGVSINITERKEQEQALKQAKQAAEEASQVKSEFLLNVSHDFRTPASGIHAMAKLIYQKMPDGPLKDTQKLVMASAKQLVILLDQVLDYSRLEGGFMKLNKQSFVINELLQETAQFMAAKTQEKQLELIVTLPEKSLIYHSDRVLLHRVLINLLSNAIKFTDHGKITLSASEIKTASHTMIEITVSDTGIGIRDRYHATIFKPFFRVESSETAKYQGIGLGLSTVKTIVTQLGGDIYLDSTLGEGTTFRIQFPVFS